MLFSVVDAMRQTARDATKVAHRAIVWQRTRAGEFPELRLFELLPVSKPP
jgi:hypothetical protein